MTGSAIPAVSKSVRQLRVANGAWTAFETLPYPALMLLATPLLAQGLGIAGFALWSLFLTVYSIGSAGSAGTAAATIRAVASNIGRGRVERVDAVLQEALGIAGWRFGVVAIALCFISIAVAAMWLESLGDPALVAAICVAVIVMAWIEHVEQVYSSVWKGMDEFARVARIDIALKLAQFAVLMVALETGSGIAGIVALCVGCAVLRLAIKRRLTLRKYRSVLRRGIADAGGQAPRADRDDDLRRLSQWGWLQGLSGVAFGSVDRLVVAACLGPMALSQYSVGMQLASQFHGLAAAGLSILVPEISRAAVQAGSTGPLAARNLRLFLLNAVVCACGYALLAWWVPDLIVMWLGSGNAPDIVAFMLPMMVAYFLLSLNVIPFHVLIGLGRMREVAVLCLIGGLLSAMVALIFIPLGGLEAASGSRLAYAIVALALLPRAWSALRRPSAVVAGARP